MICFDNVFCWPHYIENLLTGNYEWIKEYVWQEHTQFFEKLLDLIQFLIPCYIKEGKPQLVIAIGCTGGKHRSVALVNELGKILQGKNYPVVKEYRDIERV